MDYRTVSILIEKLNAAKEIIETAAPNEPDFSVAMQNIANIEETLRQSGLIQLGEHWVYPATGWISGDIIDFKDGFKVLAEDFTVRTIGGRTIKSFSHQDIDALRRDMLENKLILPSRDNADIMSRRSFFTRLRENRTYMCQEGGWINRMEDIDTPGGIGFRYYPEYISMDNSKDYCRVRFCII